MSVAAARPSDVVPTGLAMGAVRWGAHLCQFYRTARDLEEILVPYFAAGLANGEKCIWVVAAPQTVDDARAALAAAVPDLAQRIADGQIEIVAHEEWYLRSGGARASFEQVVEDWLNREQAALREGHTGLRVTGNTSWLYRDQWVSFTEYEARVHHAFHDRRIIALCSYQLDGCTPQQIVDVLRNHNAALIRRDGAWSHSGSATAALALVADRADDVQAAAPQHTVEFFGHDDFPASALARRLADALARGEGAIAVCTRERLGLLRDALDTRMDIEAALATRRLVLVDADTARAEIAGAPELGAALDAVVGCLVRDTVRAHGRVCVYGDLVDLLCRNGERELALELERWWNVLLAELPIELHCGYSVEAFDDVASIPMFRRICDAHAHVLARRQLANPERMAAELQQVASILELETARRAAVESAYVGSRNAEQLVREHLVTLQRITSLLGDAVTFDNIGSVVTSELAVALGATRSALVVGGELIVLRDVPTPREPAAVARALDAMPGRWAAAPRELAWFGGEVVAVMPLVFAGARIGTLVLGFDKPELDVTERALAEDLARQVVHALERARTFELVVQERVRVERANAAKDRFLAMLGHELRNPLSPILTATQLMRLREPEMFVKERTTIERNVDNMIRIVDDLLDVSRIARGKVELVRGPHELAAIIAQAFEATAAMFAERSHQVTIDVPSGLVVDVDAARMTQVISNLFTNAAKYTRPGGTIDVTAEARDADVVVSVTDSGVGIARELLPTIFDLFVQAPQASDRAKGGLGIGLAIARTLVELHGGTIAAASDGPGHGSRFTVTIPRLQAKVEPVGATAPAPATTHARRILVVDDNEDAAWLLAEALRLLDHDVRVTHDGISALELVREWQPEIAFLDIGLPGMDGFALCTQLAKLPVRPHLIAVTGYGQPNDRARAREAGFDAHFVKPVSLRDVQTAIEAFSKAS